LAKLRLFRRRHACRPGSGKIDIVMRMGFQQLGEMRRFF